MQKNYSITKMLKCLTSHIAQNRMLLIAIVISILLHSMFLTKFSINFPSLENGQQVIKMHLMKIEPPTKINTPDIKNKEVAKKSNTKHESKLSPNIELAPIQDIADPTLEPNNSISEILPLNDLASQESPDNNVETINDYFEENTNETSNTPPYQQVDIEYDIFLNEDKNAIGFANTIFNINENNTYKLVNQMKAKGLVSLFFEDLEQISEGTVNSAGLVPNFYSYQYGSSDEKKIYADFAWSDHVIVMHSKNNIKTDELSKGTQDLLSFMYQFMFSPPLDSMKLTLTNGKKLMTYYYTFEGEEIISTKIGDLKSLHLQRKTDDEDKTDIWLAIDYKYLPVQIIKTENNRTIKQIATKLNAQ